MTRSSTNRIASLSHTSRRLGAAMFGIVAPLCLLACPRDPPPPVVAEPLPQPQVVVQGGLSIELQGKISRACGRMAECKHFGKAGAEYDSCMRDLGRPESYQGACGAQQTSLIDCINNLQTCDQNACGIQSAAVTACGALPAGLLGGFLTGK